jgi:CheY-like chemotaxis protein
MPRILLVEDNEMNSDMLSRRLRKRGFEVAVTANRPDIILLDMSLPLLDGWDVARRLKSEPGTASIPLVALTAHAMVTDRDKALEAGCDEYETKPVVLDRLLERIESLLAPPIRP